MYNDKQILTLNSLIEINNDRILGYETATADVTDLDLKLLFAQFMQTSEKCKKELSNLVIELGGNPTDDKHAMAIIHRAWIDFKAMINGSDRLSILNSCEYGEEVTVTVYKDVFISHTESLSVTALQTIKAQHLLLQADHAKVKECILLLNN